MTQSAPGKAYREGMSLVEIVQMLPDDAAAEKWFAETRWAEGPVCPYCDSPNVQTGAKHKTMGYRCRPCRKRFSVKTGTVMESSNLGYQTWAIAMFLLLPSLKSVSSMKLHRDVKISQKAAWHLAHRLRAALAVDAARYEGPAEIDESDFGGGRRSMSNAQRKGATGRGMGTVASVPVALLLAGLLALGAIGCGGDGSSPPTTPSAAPATPAPPPAPEPEPEPVVREPVQWPQPCREWPESPCPSPLTFWSVPSHIPDAPLCEAMWGLNEGMGQGTLYGPQVALSAEASAPDHNGRTPRVTLWFDLPFQPFNFSDRRADGSQRPDESVQRTEGDWVGNSAYYYEHVGQVAGNVLDLDYGWPDEWGRPDLDFSTPPVVPFAVELRETVGGADRMDMPLLCAGAAPGGQP